MTLPRFLRVRQHFPDRGIKDLAAEVRGQLAKAQLASKTPPGGSIAIGAGSRGINNLATIVKATVDYWKAEGRNPFIFPAMGSHGAATAEGQAAVLAHYGITEATMGCPVRSNLDVVPAGRTEEGIDTFVDRLASESDGIVLVSRVKWHTGFAGEIESGLFKMMAIGLGKLAGAKRYHTHAYGMGMENMILSVGRQLLKTGKILGGVAILEDANHRTGHVEAVPAERMESRERELLAMVKSWKGHIPAPAVDLLMLDEIGKNISGAGMDTKVVNRGTQGSYNPWPGVPTVERIFIRRLSELSYGNGLGVGLSDVVNDRLIEAIDWEATTVNCLTASALAPLRMPLHYPSDHQCLEAIAPTVGRLDLKDVTYCWIKNSMELSRALVSANLAPVIEKNPAAEILDGPVELEFDGAGNLEDPFTAEAEW